MAPAPVRGESTEGRGRGAPSEMVLCWGGGFRLPEGGGPQWWAPGGPTLGRLWPGSACGGPESKPINRDWAYC